MENKLMRGCTGKERTKMRLWNCRKGVQVLSGRIFGRRAQGRNACSRCLKGAEDSLVGKTALRVQKEVQNFSPRQAGIVKPRIAVDVDEVLAQFLKSLNAYYADRFGEEYKLEHYEEYYFCKIWGVSPELSNDIVHQFFDSHHFREGIRPLPGALNVLQKLKSKCDLVVVTSRQNVIQDSTIEWVNLHYPGIFSDLHFCNHFALDGSSVPKSTMCKEINADILIDDNPSYALECASAGLKVLLFDWKEQYPWSKDTRVGEHENITQVQDWLDVEKNIDEMFFETKKAEGISLPKF